MPLFEFQCSGCDRQFELLVRSSEPPACPECGSTELEKLLSAAAVLRGPQNSLPVTSACPPSDAPPCSPHCCRLQ